MTQTAERIVLKAAGTSLVMRVESAEQVPVGKYPEYAFVGESVGGQGPRAVELRVPKASADRQLGRMEMVLADTIGKTLLFSRDENASDAAKPFWGIVLASGAKALNGTGGKGASEKAGASLAPLPSVASSGAQPAAPKEEKPSGAALYRKIAKWYLDEILPLYIEAGVPVTHEGCGAGIAALYIQANKQ